MRICFLLHEGSMRSGGQGVYLHYLSRELSRRGHEVHAIVGPPYPELDPEVQLHRIKSYSLFHLAQTGNQFSRERSPFSFFTPLNFGEFVSSWSGMYSVMGAFSLRAFQRFVELHREQPFDVVHDNQVLGYGTLFIRATGVPVVATIHHPLSIDRQNRMLEARSPYEKVLAVLFYPFFMQTVVANRLDRLISVSKPASRAVAQAFGLPPGRVDVVSNGVDTVAFQPLAGVERQKITILYVSNSEDRNKGARYLLEALRILRDEGRMWHLTVVDKKRQDLRLVPGLAEEFGIESRVTYASGLSTEELAVEYCQAQIVVSPSLYEGFGLPAAEAMACCAAVVATTAGAFPEVIEDGVSGLLVPPGDSQALAAAIRRLLDNPGLCWSLGQAARERIVERFTWARAAEQLETLYHEAIQSRRGAA